VKQLVIINNESVFSDSSFFFCDNISIKSISEGLSKNFKTLIILRNSKVPRSHQINLGKIVLASNLFAFLFKIFKTFKEKDTKYLIISITPYTFFAYLLLFIFRKEVSIYLRSDGYEEYRAIFGFIGPFIYHIMYFFVTFKSNVIVCDKNLVKKKKCELVYPSELDMHWFKDTTKPLLDKPRLLFVGRIKVEKGIFSLIKILNEMISDYELTIVGKSSSLSLQNKKINHLGYINNVDKLIKAYDNNNILILPSFTEAYPQVINESLARFRPVILFEEIRHVVFNRQGIFVTKRDAKSLSQTINFVINNYSNIQENMTKNKLPTKEEFILRMTDILGLR